MAALELGLEGQSQYAFRVDRQLFTPIGPAYRLRWGAYRGDRAGIYCYNDTGEHRQVDVACFDYQHGDQTGHVPQRAASHPDLV